MATTNNNNDYYNSNQYNGHYNSHVHDGSNHDPYHQPPPYHTGGTYQPTGHGGGRHHRPSPYAYVAAASLPARHPRILFLISITRPWAIVVPFITLVMDVWWFSTGRLCGGYDASSDCYLVLWYSMPIAVVSLIWSLATTISARRTAHHRPGIPSGVQLPIQAAVAGGATACLALLAVHLANSDWMRYNSLQGGMIALVAMITLVNWLLVGFAAYEWNLDRKYQRESDNYIL